MCFVNYGVWWSLKLKWCIRSSACAVFFLVVESMACRRLSIWVFHVSSETLRGQECFSFFVMAKPRLHPGDQVLKHFIHVMDNVSLIQAVLKCYTEHVAKDSRASHFSFPVIVKPWIFIWSPLPFSLVQRLSPSSKRIYFKYDAAAVVLWHQFTAIAAWTYTIHLRHSVNYALGERKPCGPPWRSSFKTWLVTGSKLYPWRRRPVSTICKRLSLQRCPDSQALRWGCYGRTMFCQMRRTSLWLILAS